MWCIWRETNARIFDGCERTKIGLKDLFMKTLLEWMTDNFRFTFFNLVELIDFCNFRVIL